MSSIDSLGYVRVSRRDRKSRYVHEHVLVVEKAIGHALPRGAVVHHINGIRSDNRNCNLIVLQGHAEHRSLHRRAWVLRTGGNPWTQWLCRACKAVKDQSEFYRRKRGTVEHTCKQCKSDDYKRRYAEKPGRAA